MFPLTYEGLLNRIITCFYIFSGWKKKLRFAFFLRRFCWLVVDLEIHGGPQTEHPLQVDVHVLTLTLLEHAQNQGLSKENVRTV